VSRHRLSLVAGDHGGPIIDHADQRTPRPGRIVRPAECRYEERICIGRRY
jgi:hypothetical protein